MLKRLSGVAVVAGLTGMIPAYAQDMVKINCADAATLAAGLHNVGEAKAAAIVADRDSAGPYQAAEDLGRVSGIGEKTIADNKDRIDTSTDCGA